MCVGLNCRGSLEELSGAASPRRGEKSPLRRPKDAAHVNKAPRALTNGQWRPDWTREPARRRPT